MLARSMLLGLAWGALSLVPMRATDFPAQLLPILGGGGGSSFTRSCGAGRVLTGLSYRTGLVVDAVGVLCRPVNADGSLGAQTSVGTLVGGSGGSANFGSCEAGGVVSGAYIYHGTYLDGLTVTCREWVKATRSMGGVAAGFRVGRQLGIGKLTKCEYDVQPVVQIRGREASVIDAIGFTCNEP